MPLPLPLAGVRDEHTRFALERLAQHAAPKSDLFLNARDFGMVGDNSTDNLAAFNKAIAAINDDGGTLYIPAGTYLLSGVPDAITSTGWAIFGSGPATILQFASSAAHGTFFTVGETGSAPSGASSSGSIHDLSLVCNTSSNVPPTGERAFHLVKGGTTFVYNIYCTRIGGLCKIGTNSNYDDGTNGTGYWDRFQLYGFQNIFGTWNAVTSAPSRLHIINGTDGFYSRIRLTASEVNGGKGIHADPTPRGVDQTRFDSCEIWSEGSYSHNVGHGTTYDGIDWNVYLDFTTGQIFNWIFTQCVFDEGRSGAVRVISSGGSNVCKEVHFLDCHFETNAGNGIRIDHTGSVTLHDFAVIGGRIRHKDAPAIDLSGSNIDNVRLTSVAFLQEQISSSGANATRDSVLHTFKHGLAVDDTIQFPSAAPSGLATGTTYFVKNADANGDGLEFTLAATSGGATLNITATDSTARNYRVNTPSAVQFTDAQGVQVTGCYFGAFEGGVNTRVNYAVQGTGGTEDGYNVVGNVAKGMVLGFSTGISTVAGPPTTSIVANNVSDV